MSTEQAGDLTPATTDTSQQAHIEAPPAVEAVTAASLGVDQASFDKYQNAQGVFDWASYGKEAAFKAAQAAPAPGAPEAEAPAEPAAAVEAAGLSWDDLGSKITSDGDIGAEDYAALAAIGIPDQVVKDYIGAVQGNAQSIVDNVIDGMGGQEAFDQVYAGLFTNATVEQRDKIDVLLRDPDTREAGIQTAYRLAGIADPQVQPGTQPQPPVPATSRGGTPPVTPAASGFDSFESQIAAQRDARYNKDSAYTQSVIERISKSSYNLNPRSHSGGM